MKKIVFVLALLIGFLSFSQNPAYFKDGLIVGGGPTDGTGVKAGQIKWDSDDMKFRKYDGTVWNDLIPPAGAEANNLSASVTWVNVPDAFITQSSVTQHQAALSIAWSQVTSTPVTLSGYGISDTKTNFNTALSDGTFLFVGDVTSFPGFTDLLTDYGFTDNSANWNTAFGWGNHAVAGYLTSESQNISYTAATRAVAISSGTGFTFPEVSAGGDSGLITGTDKSKLDGIEALADVTDATNVDAAGAVMESDYNANTILAATSDNTPVTLTVGEQTFVGRITGGNITALTQTQAHTLLNDRIFENATVTTTQTLDYAAYEIFNFTVTGDVTFSESNLPASGSYGKIIVLNITGNHALTYPAGWSTNITGTYDGTVNNVIVVWYIKSGTYKVQITQPN